MNKRVLGREMPPVGIGCWAMGGGANDDESRRGMSNTLSPSCELQPFTGVKLRSER